MNTPTDQTCLIVYDGTCRFCLRQMDWIRKHDRNDAFAFVARQEEDLLERYPQLAETQTMDGLRVVLPSGQVRLCADAVYEIARRLPRTRWAAWLYRIPVLNIFWRWMYGWIARRRYALAGQCGPEDESCRVGDA